MSAMQRTKGAAAERELFNLLRDELGIVVERNLVQSRSGGADSVSIPGLSIEVKRHESEFREAWWTQAVEQAGEDVPVLAYRKSRQPWRFAVPLAWVGSSAMDMGMRCTLGVSEFCFLVRERL